MAAMVTIPIIFPAFLFVMPTVIFPLLPVIPAFFLPFLTVMSPVIPHFFPASMFGTEVTTAVMIPIVAIDAVFPVTI
jgi:hypothetical protein